MVSRVRALRKENAELAQQRKSCSSHCPSNTKQGKGILKMLRQADVGC